MAKKVTDVIAQTVTYDFGDGNVETLELSKCSPEMLTLLALHGGSQKVGDSYASAKKTCEGTEIDPVAWSQEQAASVIGQIYADDWTVRTPGTAAITDLMVAFEEVTGQELMPDLDADAKKALRAHPDIAAVLARIKSERAEKKAKALAEKVGTGSDLSEYAA